MLWNYQCFLDPSSYLVFCNNTFCLRTLELCFCCLFLDDDCLSSLDILNFARYIQCTKYINNFAFKLFTFYNFRVDVNFCVVSSTVQIAHLQDVRDCPAFKKILHHIAFFVFKKGIAEKNLTKAFLISQNMNIIFWQIRKALFMIKFNLTIDKFYIV